MKILHVIGATGSGKSALMTAFEGLPPYGAATIRIGSILTARHGIEHFQGHIAPDHTQEEAMTILREAVGQAFAIGKKLCVIDGLPRKPWQVTEILKRWPNDARFVHLYCDQATRIARLEKRDKSDHAKWMHTLTRLDTDEVEVYRVFSRICELADESTTFDTSTIAPEMYDEMAAQFFRDFTEVF